MFKKKTKEPEQNENGPRKVVTETVEHRGGVQTTTTNVTCTEKDLDKVLHKLQLDPSKFQSGGTVVTRQIIYTNSSGAKEILEETVETYDEGSTKQKTAKSLTEKIGLGFGKPSKESTAASTSGESHKDIKEFEKECLNKHNEFRAKHGVPKLALSKELCSFAKEWADHLASTDTFQHRPDRKYGENIFMKWSSDPNHIVKGSEAVESWYSEIKDYTFGKEPTTLKSGHFTQVIWKGSKQMGVAWSRNDSGKVLVVANYDPAGNFIGRFTENVPAPK